MPGGLSLAGGPSSFPQLPLLAGNSSFPRLTLNSLVMLAFPAAVWHQGLAPPPDPAQGCFPNRDLNQRT